MEHQSRARDGQTNSGETEFVIAHTSLQRLSNRIGRDSVQTTMGVSEFCKDGVRVRLVKKDDVLYLQIEEMDAPEDSQEGMMPCDPDLLCAVLRGLTYQLASPKAYCMISRHGGLIEFEYQAGNAKHRCSMTAAEFTELASPLLPARLRAVLI